MHREYRKWYSTRLRRDMELLVFGYEGFPLLVFPTEKGRFFDFENFGAIATLAEAIDAGRLQVFCVDSVDKESWYNYRAAPADRLRRHLQYECYLIEEVVPFLRSTAGKPRFGTAGCSLGGYHALNFALRYPGLVERCVSMSGGFDIRPQLDAYWNDSCLFVSPLDYVPLIQPGMALDGARRVPFVLATGVRDANLAVNRQMAGRLEQQGIPVTLDVWAYPGEHDWPMWRGQVRKYFL